MTYQFDVSPKELLNVFKNDDTLFWNGGKIKLNNACEIQVYAHFEERHPKKVDIKDLFPFKPTNHNGHQSKISIWIKVGLGKKQAKEIWKDQLKSLRESDILPIFDQANTLLNELHLELERLEIVD